MVCLHSSRQGAKATRDELTMSAFLTVQLDRSLGGQAVQVGVLDLPISCDARVSTSLGKLSSHILRDFETFMSISFYFEIKIFHNTLVISDSPKAK